MTAQHRFGIRLFSYLLVALFAADLAAQTNKSRNLIPAEPGSAPNYYCTWGVQNFGDADERSPREQIVEKTVFNDPGWITRYYEKIRGDLFVVFDDGWDIPSANEGSQERWAFGSLELNAKRFPSCTGTPVQRLRQLNEKVRAAGWRGAGLWVAAQALHDGRDGQEMNEANLEKYWRERARWCREAGIHYWKVDWGARDDRESFRRMISRIVRQEAPEIIVEHAGIIMPLNHWDGDGRFYAWDHPSGLARKFAPFADVFRLYDTTAQLSTVTLLDRAAWVLQNVPVEPAAQGLVNAEDEVYLGAALGCTIGIMRHPLYRLSDPRNNDVSLYGHRIDEVIRAVRWMRLAPPFSRVAAKVATSEQTLADEWDFRAKETWYQDVIGKKVIQRAPTVIARGIELPEVVDAGDGLPFVVAARNPNGAISVASLQRTLPGRVTRTPKAMLRLQAGPVGKPIAIFGPFHSVTIHFDEPVEKRRILAQDLAGETAEDITHDVQRLGHRIIIPGAIIDRTGRAAQTPGDPSEPGLLLLVE